MKKINFLKGMLVVAILFIANLTVFAGNPGDNLIYNAEEVNGVVVSETIFKMEGTMLTNYMKHNYKYDANNQRTEDEAQKWNSNKNRWENNLCIRYTYGNKSMTTEYYKWNSKKKEYILVPEMTVTMDIALVCDSLTGEAIKRESGVNPEQSRCCKFHACYKQFTHCHWRIIWEGVCNRNKSEDLPCNYVSLLSRKKR